MKHAKVPAPPAAAGTIFGSAADSAHRYAEILAGAGVERGLLGPREINRVWDRHVLNSAVVSELLIANERIADIGSGAGLPGIPLVLARPDVRVTLVEPLLRRSDFLCEVIDELGLDCQVVRGRAEDPVVRDEVGEVDAVASRAVASLDKLAKWSAPLLRAGGRMLAIKGERAEEEIREHRRALRRMGVNGVKVMKCGERFVDPPVTVVVGLQESPWEERSRGRKRE